MTCLDMDPEDASSTCVEVVRSAEAARGDAAAIDLEWLRDRFARAAAMAGRPLARVTACLRSDAEMIRLHKAHCGLDSTTDVLTFPQSSQGEPVDVDIAVCVDEARRRAAEFGHSAERELLLYALHGLLHCCGHDDHDEASWAAMHAEEDRILAAIGVGPVFSAERPAEGGAP